MLLIEKWKTNIDKKVYGAAVFTDLSKTFDTTNRDLFLAKLHAYGFNKDVIKTIYLNDLIDLSEKTDTCSFADDTNFHASDSSLDSLVKRLEHDTNLTIEWFDSSYMKPNQGKCHLRISAHKFETIRAKIEKTQTRGGREQKLLGVDTENDFNFVITLCKKAGKK